MQPPETQQPLCFSVRKPELIFGLGILLFGLLLCNSFLFTGANLGVAVAAIGSILCSVGYLAACGYKPDLYSGILFVLSILLAGGIARTDDGFVKCVCCGFLLVSTNLGLCLMAHQNCWQPGTLTSLLDAPRTAFQFGVGYSPEVFRGLTQAFCRSGELGRKAGAFLLGLCVAVPVIGVMIPLLISADAAFDGLMALLPDFELSELIATVIFGTGFGFVCFVRGVALRHSPKEMAAEKKRYGISSITVNTVLGAVCLLYGVYLISQLAYLSGGFAGILPEGYTMAQYARRGFFEMALLSGANLTLMVLALCLVKKQERASLATRLLCLFVGIVTFFLIATASAKMFLYIGSYGLTRLRVLTQIVMLFLGVTTVVVTLWLFTPRLPYMKVVLIAALLIGAATLWTDVDTQVARYNVNAYLSGQQTTVDVYYLYRLGNGALPEMARLSEEAPDKEIRTTAQTYLAQKKQQIKDTDIRGWNYVNYIAGKYR